MNLPIISDIWQRMRGRAPSELRAVDQDIIRKLDEAGFGIATKSGAKVTIDTALGVMAVLACVRVLSEGVAQLPLHVFRRTERGKEAATDLRVYDVLRKQPNEWQSAFEFREMLMVHATLTGNGFAWKTRVDGQVVELLPLMPGTVITEQHAGWDIRYTVSDPDGGIVGTFSRDQIFHLRGPSWNGYTGMEAVRLARDAIGLSIATEEAHAKLHANGARPSGILSTDQTLSDQARTALRDAFAVYRQSGVPVLDNGLRWMPLQMTGVDAQHIETRKHQIEEVCRAFNVFPQMVMQSDKTSTYASAEAFFSAHVRHTLGPWLTRWEQAIDRDLLDGVGPVEAKFDTRELTKANASDREKFYRTVTEMGIYTRNEIREMEGLEPLPGLDAPLTPLNMTDGDTDE